MEEGAERGRGIDHGEEIDAFGTSGRKQEAGDDESDDGALELQNVIVDATGDDGPSDHGWREGETAIEAGHENAAEGWQGVGAGRESENDAK